MSLEMKRAVRRAVVDAPSPPVGEGIERFSAHDDG